MLILIRKIGEAIIINDDTKIMVLGIVNGKVRLGFEAPENVIIHREEIWDRIQKEKEDQQPDNIQEENHAH